MMALTLGSSSSGASFCELPMPPPLTPSRVEFSDIDAVLSLPYFFCIARISPLFISSIYARHSTLVVLPFVRSMYPVTYPPVSYAMSVLNISVSWVISDCTCFDLRFNQWRRRVTIEMARRPSL